MHKKVSLLLVLVFVLSAAPAAWGASETFTSNKMGSKGNFDFEYWKDSGTGSMTVNDNGSFKCSWSNINNILFRVGKKLGSYSTHSQLGQITLNYGGSFNPGGNSYLCVYGWFEDPLVEYYIIESYGTYNPGSNATSKGSVTVDGATYKLYESTRVNQPSIKGDTTFKQYWSIRDNKRTSGTIDVTAHFKAWEKAGMSCGKVYETSLLVEGYQSSGSAEMTTFSLKVGGNTYGDASGGGNGGSGNGGGSSSASSGDTRYTFSDLTFNSNVGVSSYSVSNGSLSVSYGGQYKEVKYNLPSNLSLANCGSIIVNGQSANGQTAVKFYDTSGKEAFVMYNNKSANAADWSKTLSSTEKGSTIKTVGIMSQDTGNYSAVINSITFKGVSSGSGSGSSSGSGSGSSSGSPSDSNSAVTKVQCNTMTKGGQYTGNISSPFNGVALYANKDLVSYTQYFANVKHTFSLRGASNNSNTAQVELFIGGTSYGIFKFSGTTPTAQSITATHNKTGNVKIELVCVNDNNTWDAYLDYLEIKAAQ